MSGRYGSDGRLQIDVPAASIVNASGILAFSAGTQQATSGTVTFADSNGFQWGLSNGVLTANATGLTAAANINISAGTTSNLLSAVTFSNSNHVSFGINSSTMTASYALEVAAGTATGTAANSLSALSFANSNGITWGLSSGTITASMSGGGGAQTGISGIANSETTYTSGTVSFSELGAITIRSTTGQQFQFSVNPQTNQSLGIYGISNTTGESSSSTYDARSLSFEGAGIASVGWSNSSWIVSATQSNQALSGSNGSFAFQTATFGNANGLSFFTTNGSLVGSYTVPTVTNSSWTASDSATSLTIGRLAFTGSNGITMNLLTTTGGLATLTATYTVPTVTNSSWTASDSATSLTIARLAFGTANGLTLSLSTTTGGSATLNGSYTVPSTAGLISAINGSGGTTSSNVSAITFANGTGISFQYDGTNVSANINANRVAVNGGNASAAGSANFVNANNISFNFSGAGNTRITASYEFDLSAGTTSSGVNGLTFQDSNGVSWGLNGGTITANDGYLSYWQNQPWIVATAGQTAGNSTAILMPFQIPLAGSFSYMRFPNSFSNPSTSQTATTNSSFGFSGSALSTYYAVVYSLGTGANSRSLQFVASGSGGFSQQISMSVSSGVNGSGTRWSVTQKYTFPQEGATNITASFTTAQSSGVLAVNSENANSDFGGMHFIDVPFANSLSAGAYWLAFGRSSTTSTQSLAFITGAALSHSHVCATQANQVWGLFGSAGQSSNALQVGLGSYTTNAMTTSSIALSQISSTLSHLHPYFELIRQA